MQSLLGLEHPSGTTGKALDLWWSRATVRAWYALFGSQRSDDDGGVDRVPGAAPGLAIRRGGRPTHERLAGATRSPLDRSAAATSGDGVAVPRRG